LSQKQLLSTLIELGLSRLDSQVYLYLAKKGPQKGNAIVKGLNAQKYQIYRALKNLESKGIVNATLERPAKFSAVPFETVVDMFINAKMQEVQHIQKNKEEILAEWQSISIAEYGDQTAKFNVIQGRNNIYSKILQMMQATSAQLSATLTVVELARAEEFDLFESAQTHPLKQKVQFYFLTQLSKSNVSLIKKVLSELTNGQISFEGRTPEIGLDSFPRMFIRDKEEALFFTTPKTSQTSLNQEETCLWTNSKSLVDAFQNVFNEFWRNSTLIEEKIAEIETGRTKLKTPAIYSEDMLKKQISLVSEGLTKPSKPTGILTKPILVGREREFKELQQILESVIRQNGQTVFILGEAGSGKTRLAKEYINNAKQKEEVTVISGWCQSNATNPYFPFIEAFNTYFKNDQPRTVNEGEETKAWLIGSKQDSELEKGIAISPQALKDQTFAAITKTLIAISAKKPTILFIEDLHWADSASLALLHYISRAIVSERILLLATFRSDELFADAEGHEHPLVETLRLMRREDLYKEIELANLTQPEVQKIAENMLGGTVHSQLSDKLTKESGGNALFVVESLRMLHERGDLYLELDQWRSVTEDFGVPLKVQDVILQRLNRLTRNQRKLLDAASVIGEKFDAELLGAILGKEILEVLETLDIISQTTSLICAELNAYRFDHAKFQETLYQKIPLPLRTGYHAKVADTLLKKSKGTKKPYSELAYHFTQAGNNKQAVQYTLEAGKVALSRFSNLEAIKHYTYVLETIEKTPNRREQKATAFEGLGDAYFANSMFSEATKTYERLASSVTGVARLRAFRKAMDASFFKHDFEQLRKLVEKGEQYSSYDHLEAGRVQLNRGRSFEDKSLRKLIEEQDKALKIFEEECSIRDTAWVLLGTGSCLAYVGELENGLVRMLRSLALFRELGDLRGQLGIYQRAGFAYFPLCGFIEEALDMITKAVKVGKEISSYQRLASVKSNHAWILEATGDIEDALSKSIEALKYSNKTEDLDVEGMVCANLVRLYALIGDIGNSERFFDRLVQRPSGILAYGSTNVDLARAILLATKKKWPESEEYFKESLTSSNIEAEGYRAWVKLIYASSLEKEGKHEKAKLLREESLKTYLESEEAFARVNVKTFLMVRRKVVVGEKFEMRIDMVNVSTKSASLVGVNGLASSDNFKITSLTRWSELQNENLNMKNKEIGAFKVETAKLQLQAEKAGSFIFTPDVSYLDNLGKIVTSKLEPFEIAVIPRENI
jgi:sugar-specific transcriptional regulator TrmB/tetratricopeptide (TPR) repeat protein